MGYIKMSSFRKKTSIHGGELFVGLDKGNVLIPLEILLSYIGGGEASAKFFGSAEPGDTPEPPTGDGFWIVTTPGTYTNFGGFELPESSIGVITRVDGTYVGQVADFNLDNYISKDDLSLSPAGLNEFNPALIQNDTVIVSNGNIGSGSNYVGSKAVIGQPVIAGQDYFISGVSSYGSKYIAFKDEAGVTIPPVLNFGTPPKVITAPAGATRVDYTVRFTSEGSDSWFDTLMWEKGTEASPYEPYAGEAIERINNMVLAATKLLPGNHVPEPTNESSAISKKYLERKAILTADLEIQISENRFDPSRIVNDKYVGNTGTLANGADWQYIAIPLDLVEVGGDITIGRISPTNPGYWAFYTNETNGVVSNGSYASGSTFTLQKPSGANWLLITIKRNSNTPDVYAQGTVNFGSELLPYTPYADKIVGIKGYVIEGGGQPGAIKFSELTDVPNYLNNGGKGLKINDEESGLETFEPVEQGSDVTFGMITASGVVVENVPIWDESGTPPIEIGQEYLFADGTGNYFRKVRGT